WSTPQLPPRESPNRTADLAHGPGSAGGTDRPADGRRKSLLTATGGHWTGVFLKSRAPGGDPTRRGTLSDISLPADQRVSLRTTRVPRSGIQFQACPHPGGRLPLHVAGAAQGVARAHWWDDRNVVRQVARRSSDRTGPSFLAEWQRQQSTPIPRACQQAGGKSVRRG